MGSKHTSSKRDKERRNSKRRRVRFSVPPKSPSPASKILGPRSNWENIVIHYLSKLKDFLTPSNCSSLLSVKCPSNTTPNRECPNNHPSKRCDRICKHERRSQSMLSDRSSAVSVSMKDRKRKAMKIVSAAIEYGRAQGIIENNGKYFWMKNIFNKVANRSPTPAPRKHKASRPHKTLSQKFSVCVKTSSQENSRSPLPKNKSRSCTTVKRKKSRISPCETVHAKSNYSLRSRNSQKLNVRQKADMFKARFPKKYPPNSSRAVLPDQYPTWTCNCPLCRKRRVRKN